MRERERVMRMGYTGVVNGECKYKCENKRENKGVGDSDGDQGESMGVPN